MVKYVLASLMLFLLLFESRAQVLAPFCPDRVLDRPVIDGKLSETAWSDAEVLNSFLQFYPLIGGRPSQPTEVRILYDDFAIYIGIVGHDSTPDGIIATGLERDVYYSSDDHICITLDTYNDKRQAILISSNVLGARFDEEVFDNGNGFNSAYNTFWNVVTHRDEAGYSMEFQIPFSSLRFQQADEVVMAIKVLRYIKRQNEYDAFPATDPTVANAVWRVNNAQPIVFKNLRTKRPLYFIPYAKANYQQSKSWSSDLGKVVRESEFIKRNHFTTNRIADKFISNIGFDVKYGISKNFTLDATVNTDFAQAETDNRIFNFTRFAINLPEKRNFFLESKDYLGFTTGSGVLLFNSRTIGIERGNVIPIIGGVRVSGKSYGLQLGFLDLQTSGMHALNIDPQHFSVLRLRKEIWGNGSYIGGIITNRLSTSGHSVNNQVIGFDALKRFKDNRWIASVNLGVSNDKQRKSDVGGKVMGNFNLFRVATLGYNHTSCIEYSGSHFRPQIGFAPDSAYFLFSTSNGYVRKWKNSKYMYLFWFTQTLNYKYRTINRTHESLYAELELGSSNKSGATILVTPLLGREYLPYAWNFTDNIVIPSAYYSYTGIRVRYDSRQTGRLNYSVTSQYNGFYDGNRFNILFNGYYAINRNFRVNYKYEYNSFHWPNTFSGLEQPAFVSNLVSVGIAYTQSIHFSIKGLLQYDDISKTIGSNFRLRFNPKEGTDLYVVYNPRVNTQFNIEDRDRVLMVDQQTIIIKFTKAFAL
ncbi:MAG: DUF5916 domain-containing protein [Chryseolinea sp.]